MEVNRKRKALSDCTNTSIDTNSSIKKPSKPSFTSGIKNSLSNSHGVTVIESNLKPDSSATDENSYQVTTAKPCSIATSKSLRPKKTPPVLGARVQEASATCSLNTRKKTADKRKSKGKEIAQPLTFSPAVGAKTTGRIKENNKKDAETSLTKSCTAPREKKKKDNSKYVVPQDYIEKQRAYFAEIDAFELPEEEVESIDQLE